MHNKLYVVVGLGITGLSVVKYLVNKGFTVAVTDSRATPPNIDDVPTGVQTSFGALDGELILQADTLVVSPGLSLETPEIAAALDKGIEVIGDVHLLAQKADEKNVPIIAITGSNAKSTVTTLVGEMAKTDGKNVAVGGNLGKPALELLEDDTDLIVLETSSFQLESTRNLNAQVATILNMSADHLDRHHTMENYAQAKQMVFEGAKNAVVNLEDTLTVPTLHSVANHVGFSSKPPHNKHDFGLVVEETADGKQTWLVQGTTKLINSNELKIKGIHNLLNALASLALGQLAGLSMDNMLKALTAFKGLEHRCAYVTNLNGVECFNDSKGTNVGSTLAAINGLGESYQSLADNKKLLLILGGVGKGQDFSLLSDAIAKHVKTVLLIGEDAPIIKQALPQGVQVVDADTLEQAVHYTTENAQSGDVLLLSPACASFDQFKSFNHRGDVFVDLVSL